MSLCISWRIFLSMAVGAFAWAHEGHHRGEAQLEKIASEEVRLAYRDRVRPIFSAKCFDCHSHSTHYPWYYAIPGLHQMIDGDIREALEHMDMSDDFPFHGHASVAEDLKDLKKEVGRAAMPPRLYRFIHRSSNLTNAEKAIILQWIELAQTKP